MSIYEQHLDKNIANYSALSPLSFLERSRKVFPEQIAIEYDNYSINYNEAGKRCDSLAGMLKSFNVVKNDTVAVMLPNIPQMWECHFGIPMLGAVLNAINTRLDANTINFILKHAEAKVLIYDSSYSETIEKALENLEQKPITLEVVDEIGGFKRSNFAEKNEYLDYESELKKFKNFKIEHKLPVDEWESIALNYTSGTTGNPKGVVYHHRGAYLNSIGNTLVWEMPMNPKYLWTLPMFHCNGWCFPWTVTERAGTHVCLRQPVGELIVNAILKHKVTHLCGAPIIMQMIADHLISNKIELNENIKMIEIHKNKTSFFSQCICLSMDNDDLILEYMRHIRSNEQYHVLLRRCSKNTMFVLLVYVHLYPDHFFLQSQDHYMPPSYT